MRILGFKIAIEKPCKNEFKCFDYLYGQFLDFFKRNWKPINNKNRIPIICIN